MISLISQEGLFKGGATPPLSRANSELSNGSARTAPSLASEAIAFAEVVVPSPPPKRLGIAEVEEAGMLAQVHAGRALAPISPRSRPISRRSPPDLRQVHFGDSDYHESEIVSEIVSEAVSDYQDAGESADAEGAPAWGSPLPDAEEATAADADPADADADADPAAAAADPAPPPPEEPPEAPTLAAVARRHVASTWPPWTPGTPAAAPAEEAAAPAGVAAPPQALAPTEDAANDPMTSPRAAGFTAARAASENFATAMAAFDEAMSVARDTADGEPTHA
jgi:hypothetical protein